MTTAEIRAEWQRRAAAIINSDGEIDSALVGALLRFAALNAPMADTANLFQLFESAPTAVGALVPAAMAPAGLPRIEVLARNPAAARSRATATPALARVAAIPEALRADIAEAARKADWAGNCLAEIAEEEDKKREAVAVQEAAAILLELGGRADPDPAAVVAATQVVSNALSRARADNELANFVLGDDGAVTANLLDKLQADVGVVRDQTPARAATAPTAVPEWVSQSWVDVDPILNQRELLTLIAARQDALSRSGADDDLESALAARFADEEELAAAVEVARVVIGQAIQPASMDGGVGAIRAAMPSGVVPGRFADILGAGLDTAMGRIRPVLRVANVAPGQEDFATRQMPVAAPVAPVAPAEKTSPLVAEVSPVAPPTVPDVKPVPPAALPAPVDPRFKVGDVVEYRTARGAWARDKVNMVVPIDRKINMGADSLLEEILGADATQYHLSNGETVGGEGIRAAVGAKVSPLYVPTPAYEVQPNTAPVLPPALKAESPESIKVGDWIEYSDKTGVKRVGLVHYISTTTPFIPGVDNTSRKPDKTEYSLVTGQFVGTEGSPRRIGTPALSASQMSAMFFSGLDWRDKGGEHAHAKLLAASTPSEFEKSIGYNPADAKENYAIARRLSVAFAAMKPEDQVSLRHAEQEGGESLQTWVEGMLNYWNEVGKEDRVIAALASGDLKVSVESAVAGQAANEAEAEADSKATQVGVPEGGVLRDAPMGEGEPELESPNLGAVPAAPVGQTDEAGIDPASLHAGKFRVWFLTETARKRVDCGNRPWDAVLAETVAPSDYELIAKVAGAHTLEVFRRLQNGLQNWADSNDPGAAVSLNLAAADGRLRRRNMEFADLIEDEESGSCYLVGANAVMEVARPPGGLSPRADPKWQAVPTGQGFADPIEEMAPIGKGSSSRGRGRK